jgi:hypothetical protein
MLYYIPVSIYQPEWSVRANSINSEKCDQDLKAIFNAKNLPLPQDRTANNAFVLLLLLLLAAAAAVVLVVIK